MVERVYPAIFAENGFDVKNETKAAKEISLNDSIFGCANKGNLLANSAFEPVSNSIFDAQKRTDSSLTDKSDIVPDESWNSLWGDEIPREFRSWFSGSGDSDKNGVIGNTYQQRLGDCWLLAGVNALNYTEKGREAIKNAIEYHNDGSATVHFKGGYGDYNLSKEEIEKSRDGGFLGMFHKYSTGDTDMNVLELAVEKAYGDIAAGRSTYTGLQSKNGFSETPQGIRDAASFNV